MNKKIIGASILGVLLLGLVIATSIYFHQTSTTIVVDEGRSSADLPLTINGLSGETTCRDITITNNANVPLKSILSYQIDSNENEVEFTSNLDGGLQVTTNPLETNTYSACFTINPTTDAGIVQLTINYQKTA